MSATNPSAVYFPGFNGVRFLAASSVVFHHIEQFKTIYGYTDTFTRTNDYPVVYQAGRLGVALFFVLSGFLITYLLLAEKQYAGRIHIGNFYVRRVLRIWPLYFWIVGLSFFVFPHIPALYIPGVSEFANDHFWSKLAFFGIVMPNIALALYHEMPLCSHTWSIGVEEQFYLIWPWLIGSLRPRRTLLILASIAFVLAGIFFWLRYGPGSTAPEAGTSMLLVSDFLAHFRIGTMAIGGIGAYLVFKKHPILTFLYLKPVQWVVYAVLATMLALGVRIPGLNYEGYALFFVFLLMNLAANPNSVINLENKFFNFMGKISYGTYMYHPVVIVLSLYVIRQFIPYGLGFSVLLYVASYALTTLVAWVSYEYFEKQFLKLKDRFAPGGKPVKSEPVVVSSRQ
ncbi:acyltransferase [Spirosoma terrae]|uniref:Acyltransferase n=1 Tax=Spirosoma terrae TaxID=1968276 RepID=A0A6L9L0H7_9BACT|nr:acyltransferase [Spirosoma terrae]NDU94025.1 acyltransferase [Spirosoma terrae]